MLEKENEQFQIRLSKRNELIKQGILPYQERYEVTHRLHEASALPDNTEGIKVAGRLISIRSFGRLIFGHIQDLEGAIQIALEKKKLGADSFNFFKKMVDIGDFIGINGIIMTTRTGEKTIAVNEYQLLSKTLRSLPEKWHGLTDIETRLRQRYLDLIMDRENSRRFITRAKINKVLRNFLEANNFIEVETPILQTKPSGALAIPFKTHHRALNIDCFLRIAPETYLKRCIAGGFDRVYELGRSFRNEGMDPSHLQDFSMLEYYAAYWNYRDNMVFTKQLVQHLIQEVMGKLTIEFMGNTIDFSGDWEEKSIRDLILEDCDIDINNFQTRKELLEEIKAKGIELDETDKAGYGKLVDLLYKKVSRPQIINPMFLTSHPLELSPLARKNDKNPLVTDRFQLVINGWEIVNAYSELIDPIDQRNRFEEQARLKVSGDEEALPMDEDYLLCMEHGMPPISGWGMGIDRVVSLLTGQDNLREAILFPFLKPKSR